MKSIPTRYRHVKFRSRLEARWAVFFGALDLKWEYEPEGFDVDGNWYLPDFYLSDLHCFAEIKPFGGDFSKAVAFARRSEKSIWLCEGPPMARVYDLIARPEVMDGERCELDKDLGVLRWKVTPCWDQAMDEKRFFWEPGYENEDGFYDEEWCLINPRYMAAVEKANSFDFLD